MDIVADYANPIGFDQRLIMDKLGYDTPSTIERSGNVNERLRLALLEHELDESRRKLQEVDITKRQPAKETFVSGGSGGSCGCSGGSEGMRSRHHRSEYRELEDGDTVLGMSIKKFMIIIIVIMAAFCVSQYLTHQHEMRELMAAMCMMMKNGQGIPVSQGQSMSVSQSSGQNVTTPPATQ